MIEIKLKTQLVCCSTETAVSAVHALSPDDRCFCFLSMSGSLRAPECIVMESILGPLSLLGIMDGSGRVFSGEQGSEGAIYVRVGG